MWVSSNNFPIKPREIIRCWLKKGSKHYHAIFLKIRGKVSGQVIITSQNFTLFSHFYFLHTYGCHWNISEIWLSFAVQDFKRWRVTDYWFIHLFVITNSASQLLHIKIFICVLFRYTFIRKLLNLLMKLKTSLELLIHLYAINISYVLFSYTGKSDISKLSLQELVN